MTLYPASVCMCVRLGEGACVCVRARARTVNVKKDLRDEAEKNSR